MFQWSPLTVMGCLGSTLYPTTIGPKNIYCRDISIYILYHLIPPIYLRLYIYIYTYMYIYIQIYTYIYIYTHIYNTHYLSPNILMLLPDLPTSSRSSSSRRGACATRPTARAKSKLTRAKSCAYQPFGLPLGVELSLMTCDMPRKNGSFNRENVDHHQIWR